MSRLYMMRHGQTLFNVLHRKQGWCDSPLTELGIEQAKAARDWFAGQGITFDHAYSSTSERACDTLELVAPGMPYERVKGLKEWNFGRLEGLTEDVDPKLPYRDFFVQFGGEDEFEFRDRYFSCVLDLMRRPDHESVLIVSHGAACAQFPRAFGVDLRDATGKRVGNCGIAIYDFDGEHFELVDVENPNA